MNTPLPGPPPAPADIPFRSVHSVGLPALLERLGVSVLVSTYQAGKLMAVRSAQGRISTLLRSFEVPMGLALDGNRRLALGTRSQVWFFHNAPEVGALLEPQGRHDACFVPRTTHVTGNIRGHEIAWAGNELWIVNTHFSCLCTLHPDYSFVPRWRPPFVSALAGEDRCHLNGLALLDERPRYVTALGESDTAEGWRPTKATGGILIDVTGNEVLVRGLSMPHSPRLHAGRLWLLDSGTGRLLVVDPTRRQCDTVAALPGFTRGLDFHGRYAFVGLSRIRETAVFGGLPIAALGPNLQCGLWVVDLQTGQTGEFLRFEAGIEEIFAVQVFTGVRYPAILGLPKEVDQQVFVLPPG